MSGMPVGSDAAGVLSVEGSTLNHIGIVVADIASSREMYGNLLGLAPISEVFEDPLQDVKVQFLGFPHKTSVELIEPLSEKSPARLALEKGGGLNHLCLEVDDLDDSLRRALASGAICTRRPVPAVAFGGRRIAFVFHRKAGLIEFVERPPAP